MKNFFKKLSFVLAIAMVLTSLAPATASAAAKNYVAVNGKKATATYAYIGGKEVVLTPYVNGKKATKVTIENSNPEKATIDNNGVITPVANGNTIVTFKKGDKKIGTVTVKVRTRAKALNIYDRAEYKAGKKEKLSEVTLKVGDKKDLQITMPLYKVSKKAGAVKASYFTYAEVDGTAVKVTKNAGQRNFTVEAVEAGTAKVTIVANQKTEKNVRGDKYYKEASFDVTVKDEKISAKQTGAQKITVTGVDLTDKVADYVVKRGTVALSVKEVKLNDAKTEAVLVAASSNMPKGDYTLSFKEGDAVEFTVEDAKVASIVIDPEKAIMTSTTTAVAYYKVFNQFDEDVTSGILGSDVDASGSDGATDGIDRQGKKVVFTNPQGYTMNLSQVSLALVCKTNGVNVTKVLTVSEGAKLASAEFAGVYKAKGTSYVAADLTEGLTSANLGDYYLFFKGLDQYGMPFVDVDQNKLNVNILSTTGLQLASVTAPATNPTKVTLNYVDYYAFKLAAGTNPLGSGEVTVMTVCLNNGAQTSDKITVSSARKVAKITVSAKDSIYGNHVNELAYEILDQNGEAITDYVTLKELNNRTNLQQYAASGVGVRFVRNADGTAKLVYQADSNTNPVSTPVVLTFLSDTNQFSTADIKVLPNPVVKAVIGIDKDVVLGAMSGVDAAGDDLGVNLTRKDFMFQDQYGNVLADDDVALNGIKLDVTFATTSTNFAAKNKVASTAAVAKTDMVVTTGAISGTTTAALGVKVAIVDPDHADKIVAGSEYSFNIYSVALDDLSEFAVADFTAVQPSNTEVEIPFVYGYYSGVKVRLNNASYEVHDGDGGFTVTTPAIAVTEGKVEKEGTVTVDIHNLKAEQITKTYKYSNEDSKVALALNPYAGYATTKTVNANAASAAAADVKTLIDDIFTAKDQYGANKKSTTKIFAKISGFEKLVADGKVEVADNGKEYDTTNVYFKDGAGEYTLTITLSTLGGATLTEDVTFVVD